MDHEVHREKFYRAYAEIFIRRKVEEINKRYGFTYNRISIKNTKSQWGSCSSKRNLNFSYKLIFLPEHLSHYVIAHELCHLEEFNHGPKFWRLVGRSVKRYKECEAELRDYYLD